MATKPVRFGILSTARINEKLLATARGSAKLEVVAAGSRSPERAAAFARTHGLARAHGSYEALLADDDVEVVYVSLPNALHIPWTILALRHGKHVLCEKPLSPRAAEVEEAFDVAEAEGRLLSEAFMYRFHPQLDRVRELLADGAIGDLRLVSSSFRFPADPIADATVLKGPDGGSLLDVGCYCVSASRLLAGEPEVVQGEVVPADGDGVDLRFVGTLRCRSGVLAQFDSSVDLPHAERLELMGSRGTLALSDPWGQGREARIELRRDDGREVIELGVVDAYTLQFERFAAAVRGGPPPPGREESVSNARVLQALLESARTGTRVELGSRPAGNP